MVFVTAASWPSRLEEEAHLCAGVKCDDRSICREAGLKLSLWLWRLHSASPKPMATGLPMKCQVRFCRYDMFRYDWDHWVIRFDDYI